MKKVLLLAGLMAVSSMALGEVVGTNEVSGDVTVKANVVASLKIKANDVLFGDVAQGQTKKGAYQNSTVTITGQPSKSIELSITKDGATKPLDISEIQNGFVVDLATTGAAVNPGDPTTMEAKLKVNNWQKTQVLSTAKGEYTFEIMGDSVTAASNQTLGTYTTKVTVKAKYQ